jgi:hypothetical protein
MAITGTEWHWFTAWGDGYNTIDVNIAPAWVGVQTALQGQSGGGTNYTGIKHYRKRLGTGKDKDIDYGGLWYQWPPAIYDYISSVTFAIATGEDQEAWLIGRMDYFG